MIFSYHGWSEHNVRLVEGVLPRHSGGDWVDFPRIRLIEFGDPEL